MPCAAPTHAYKEIAPPGARRYKRKSFFVDEAAISKARKALGVQTDAEAVRVAIERVLEIEAFRVFMRETRGTIRPGGFETPSSAAPFDSAG